MTTRRLLVLVALLASTVGGFLVPASATAAPPQSFTTLNPGGPAKLTEKIPVQVVMLGYEEVDVPRDWFGEYLPNYARPIDRFRTSRRIVNKYGDDITWADPRLAAEIEEMGLHYSFDHSVVYAEAAYEDAFFDYLLSIGADESSLTGYDVSLYQYLYNLQQTRTVDITKNLVLDPSKVEQWLLENPAPGVDPSRNTVVLVNWWGRDDFRFHEYEPVGDPQSETGVSMPQTYWENRMIAFGGTSAADDDSLTKRPSRTWFHDLSAGPDWRTGNWVLDDNLGGYGPDPSWQTVFPPVWEYALGGAQDRWALPDALGVITRFVAVNLYFASSPVYGTDTDAHISDDIELDITNYGNELLTPTLLVDSLGDLLGTRPKIDVDQRPYAGTPAKCHQAFLAIERCRPEADPSVYGVDADFFVGAERERPKWQDKSAGYEAPGFVYQAERPRRWIAFADDNWTEGNRTAVHSFLGRSTHELGYGTTSVMVHEYGHHFGVSHPHDGFETEWGPFGYTPNDKRFGLFYFAWVGDEVNTVMSYLHFSNEFSQFDVDNYQRAQAARYLRAANMIAGQVQGSPKASAGTAHLRQADAAFTAAQVALTAHDYPTVAAKAAEGYQATRAAATAARVTIPTVDRWAMTDPGSWHGKGSGKAFEPATEPLDARVGGKERPAALAGYTKPGR